MPRLGGGKLKNKFIRKIWGRTPWGEVPEQHLVLVLQSQAAQPLTGCPEEGDASSDSGTDMRIAAQKELHFPVSLAAQGNKQLEDLNRPGQKQPTFGTMFFPPLLRIYWLSNLLPWHWSGCQAWH